MNFELTEKQLDIQKLARDFTEQKVAPKVLERDETREYDVSLYTNKKNKLTPESSLELLHAVRPRLAALDAWTPESVLGVLSGLAEEREMKIGKVMWPVRIAVSGKAVTPGGPVEICTILGKEEALRRIGHAIHMLEVDPS